MRTKLKATLTAVVAAGTLAAVSVVSGETATAGFFGSNIGHSQLRAVGLTGDGIRIVQFKTRSSSVERPRLVVNIGGLQPGESLVGIDYRVQDGLLYGISNQNRIYTLNPATGAATFVQSLTVPLDGTVFGVDFNPAADRLRIVGNTGQNLSHDLNAGITTAQTPLSYPPAPPPVVDSLTGIAYTNNDLSATTGTTLFDIDTTLNQVAIQSPPAAGTLVPTGRLGVDAEPGAGFDIYSKLVGGVSVDSLGFAALSVGGRYGLYSINLLTGQADIIGQFPVETQVADVAVPLAQ